MKLHLDRVSGINTLTAHGAGHVTVNGERHDANLIVTPERLITGWAAGGFETLGSDDFAIIATLGVRIVLLGTGPRQRFPDPKLLHALTAQGIGIEIMELSAACRTYNVLALEGRTVAAALLLS
jgi:uncharacterized protein